MPYTAIPSGTLGNIPADQLPSVEQWLNQSGLTMGTPIVNGPSDTANPFAGILDGGLVDIAKGPVDAIGNALRGAAQAGVDAAGGAMQGAGKATADAAISWLFSGRTIAIIGGAVFVIAGLFLLKNGPVVNVVTKTAKAVAVGG